MTKQNKNSAYWLAYLEQSNREKTEEIKELKEKLKAVTKQRDLCILPQRLYIAKCGGECLHACLNEDELITWLCGYIRSHHADTERNEEVIITALKSQGEYHTLSDCYYLEVITIDTGKSDITGKDTKPITVPSNVYLIYTLDKSQSKLIDIHGIRHDLENAHKYIKFFAEMYPKQVFKIKEIQVL